MYKILLMNMDELWLKGKNRIDYVKKLRNHIHAVSKGIHRHQVKIRNENQRLIVSSEVAFEQNAIDALQKIPGLHSIQPAILCSSKESEIEKVVSKEVDHLLSSKFSSSEDKVTFRISTHRIDKSFPINSMEMNRLLGGVLLKEFPRLKVKVKNQEIDVQIKIIQPDKVYISCHKIKGVGGLPVGSSGHLVTLLSGGFDSPVASYMMSARGCKQTLVFFHAYPFVGDEVKEKIEELSKILAKYQIGVDLCIVPFGKIQEIIAAHCYEEYRTVLFRWAMVKSSNLLAEKVKAHSLLTGDSLGQVSSQTIGNIELMNRASKLPILRPLIGLSKRDIMNKASEIGTHDISVIPHDDACALFSAKYPIIRPNAIYWDRITRELEEIHGLGDLFCKSLDEAEYHSVSLTGRTRPFIPNQ